MPFTTQLGPQHRDHIISQQRQQMSHCAIKFPDTLCPTNKKIYRTNLLCIQLKMIKKTQPTVTN